MKKLFVLLLVLATVVSAVFAQGAEETANWPTQPIHIIGQSAAGSGPDLFVRELQPLLQKELGVSIVVENKAGSGGKIASDYVWKANPDGYTLLAHSSPLTTVTQISKDCEYSIKDMQHIVAFDAAPYAVIVKADSPINTVEDLIAYCKNNKASNANSGIGGAMYLQSRIMADALGIDYNEVPYNGSNPCTLAVMNGDVTFTVTSYDVAFNNDQVKVVCLLSDQRIDLMPEVPAITESGYNFAFMTMRRGIIAPADTPEAVVNRLIDAFKVVLADPSFAKFVETTGTSLDIRYGEDYKALDVEYFESCSEFKSFLE